MKASALEQTPFPPLQLSPTERQRLQTLANELLEAALDEYERVGAPERRQLPKTLWKPIKSRENCTVFASKQPVAAASARRTSQRTSNRLVLFDPYNYLPGPPPASVASSDSSTLNDDDGDALTDPLELQDAPELVLAGSVPGSLDDTLFGLSACDSADVLVHSALVDDSLVDGAVLAQLQLPTRQEPFRFLGVKWAAHEYRGAYKKPSSRDFVYLEAVGSVVRSDGSRLGYVLRHSLTLAACGDLASERRLVRGSLAMSAVLTPVASSHSVDVFAYGKLRLGGFEKPRGSTTLATCASVLLTTANNAVRCAHARKLVWRLRQGGADPKVPVVRADMFACGMCAKPFGKLSSVGTCRVCCVQMCSRCRLTRTLSAVAVDVTKEKRTLTIESVGGVFCKNCIARANQTDAFAVASDEVSEGRYGPSPIDNDSDNDSHESRRRTTSSSRLLEPPPLSPSFLAPMSYDSNRSTDVSRASSPWSIDERQSHEEVSGDAIGVREFHGWSYANPAVGSDHRDAAAVSTLALVPDKSRDHVPSAPSQSQSQSTAAMDTHQQQRQALWRKMAELRLQAESVYQLTKQNEARMRNGSPDLCYDSDIDELD